MRPGKNSRLNHMHDVLAGILTRAELTPIEVIGLLESLKMQAYDNMFEEEEESDL